MEEKTKKISWSIFSQSKNNSYIMILVRNITAVYYSTNCLGSFLATLIHAGLYCLPSLFYSQFIYELTCADAAMPSEETVQMWLQKIGDSLGVAFRYTLRLGNTLIHRAQQLPRTIRKFQGGRRKTNFLQQKWKLRVKTNELSAQALIQQNDSLTQQNDSLSLQVHTLTQQSLSLAQQNDHSAKSLSLSLNNQPVFLNRSTL
jgi:cell division protein FtsB